MRKIWIVSLMALVSVACMKDDVEKPTCNFQNINFTAPATEVTNLMAFLEQNNIDAFSHSSGLYYKIEIPGESLKPTVCDTLEVKYVGMLSNGTIFDQTTGSNTAKFILGQLILGWQKGIPLIGKGGRIRLYLPPSLGYGANPYPSANNPIIPGNSILIFDIDLVDFKPY